MTSESRRPKSSSQATWLAAAIAAATALPAQQPRPILVGSKNFTESTLLGEIMAQTIEARTGLTVERRINLGGTQICWAALTSGRIDLYAEYTGTGWAIVLGETTPLSDPMQTFLAVDRRCREEFGVRWLEPFGFENTYALAMPESRAQSLGIRTITDLATRSRELRAGFSVEFLNRGDGWPGLAERYGLGFASVRGMEHTLTYSAVATGEVDVIDAYSTDAKLITHGLRILADDRRFFPPYHGAPVVREATLAAHPEIGEALHLLSFRLDAATMGRLNHRVEEGGLTFAAAARAFLTEGGILTDTTATSAAAARRAAAFLPLLVSRAGITARLALEHLLLAGLAVLLATAIAVPLGIATVRRPTLRRLSLALAGILQTIPSLALLAMMIPFLGIDVRAAVAALLLYALLPILRNTCAGIAGVDRDLVDAARGMGMTDGQILRLVELPLCLPTIMAGVRTAAVIAIGVATLAAFIGAGGLGEPIVTGLYLNDTALILTGAVPAAVLALVVDGVLGRVERRLQPAGTGDPPA